MTTASKDRPDFRRSKTLFVALREISRPALGHRADDVGIELTRLEARALRFEAALPVLLEEGLGHLTTC